MPIEGIMKGDKKDLIDVKKSIYSASISVGLLVFILSDIINILIGVDYRVFLASLGITLVLSVSLYLHLKMKFYRLSRLITFISLLIFAPIFWKYDGGIQQTITFYLLAYITIAVILLSGWEKIIFLSLSFLMMVVFFALEVNHPEIVTHNDFYSALANNIFGGIVVGVLITSLLSILLSAYQKIKNELEGYNKKLEYLSRKDPLTGLSNRRDIFEKIETEIERTKRTKEPFSLIMGDIDDFKKINDTYGHKCGDLVLKRISDIMIRELRKYDTASRWGGEEFLILLPKTKLNEALSMARRLKSVISKDSITYDGKSIHYTITLGVIEHKDPSINIDEYIKRIDMALYKGKKGGKNQVVAYYEK